MDAQLSDLVLEEETQRFHQFEFQVVRQAADIVMGLDDRGRAPVGRHRFDDIGIEGPLAEEFRPVMDGGLLAEDFDEFMADALAFFFGIGDPGQDLQKAFLGIHHGEVQFEMVVEGAFDEFTFSFSQEAVVHENSVTSGSHRLLADGPHHGGIHPA